MTYLSMLSLTGMDSRILRLYDPYAIHQMVWSLFPCHEGSAHGRFLYADKGFSKGKRHILLLSRTVPVIARRGIIETKEINARFFEYSAYRFQITINAARKQNSTGKYIPLAGRDEISEWFSQKALGWGFEAPAAQVVKYWGESFNNTAGRRINLSMAIIHGGLLVRDREKFIYSFKNGLGRGKAFGCGLLQLAPAF